MFETKLTPEFMNPSVPWLFEVNGLIVWVCLFLIFVRQSIRARTLTFGLLLLISSTTMFWQEWYSVWGAYLLYNPKFNLMPWGKTLWTTPNKPWAVIPSYGFYFTCIYLILLSVIQKVRFRFPNLGQTAAVLIVTVPIFYAWDLIFEGGASFLGWFSYVTYVGPAIVSSKGNFPLLYPILPFALYVVIAVWFLGHRGPDGRVRFESWFRIERIRNSAAREVARIGVWAFMMNAVFLVFLTIPLIAIRELFGPSSTIVP